MHWCADVYCKNQFFVALGTTMNTLKFPIMNAKTNWLMKMRQDRLRLTKAKEMVKRIKVIEETKKSKKLMASSILTTLRGTYYIRPNRFNVLTLGHFYIWSNADALIDLFCFHIKMEIF